MMNTIRDRIFYIYAVILAVCIGAQFSSWYVGISTFVLYHTVNQIQRQWRKAYIYQSVNYGKMSYSEREC